MKYAIELENLRKVFSGRKKIIALNDVSFNIRPNTAVGYLGPNGAGKTTTIKILTNILKPTSGTARIFDFDIRKEPIKALQMCGTILEVPEFYPYLTPRETMTYLGKIRGMNKSYLNRRIKETLEEVEMEEWIDVKIGKFSTGMKQRTAIAQALIHEPPLLILDEPTNGLDPRGMAKIRALINNLKKKRTIFLSSHLLNEVELICDTVVLINKGDILAFDSLANIQHLLQATQLKAEFLDPVTEQQLRKIEDLNEVQSLRQENRSLLINYNGTNEASSSILDFIIKDLGLRVYSFQPIQKRLEEFYIHLIEDEIQKGGKVLAVK